MYGADAGVTTATLAATGSALTTGSFILGGVALVLAGIALYLIVRKESKVKP